MPYPTRDRAARVGRAADGRRVRRLAVLAALMIGLVPGSRGRAAAQDAVGGSESALAGAALGAYSGGVSGLVGSLLPCNRTLLGPKCAAVGAWAGGVVGLVAGGVAGSQSEAAIRDRAGSAAYGLLVGVVAGSVLQRAVRQYGWHDALLVAAYGAAVGAAPRGTLIGAGIGAALGAAAWASPRGGLADLILFTVVGSAAGGLYDWVEGAVDPEAAGGPRIVSSFSVRIG